MIRVAAFALIFFVCVGYLLQVDAPSAQQEAEDVSAEVTSAPRDAKRQAREERREQWLQAEMKKRGCTP